MVRFMEQMVGSSLKFIKPLQQNLSNKLDVTMHETQMKTLLSNLCNQKKKLSKEALANDYRPLLEFLCRSGCRPNEALKIIQPKLHHPDEPAERALECATWKQERGVWVASISGEFTKTAYRYQWRFSSTEGVKLAKELVALHKQKEPQNRPAGRGPWSYYQFLYYFRGCCKQLEIAPKEQKMLQYSLRSIRKAAAVKVFKTSLDTAAENAAAQLQHANLHTLKHYVHRNKRKEMTLRLIDI